MMERIMFGKLLFSFSFILVFLIGLSDALEPPGKIYLIDLEYNNGGLNLLDLEIVEGYSSSQGDSTLEYKLELFSAEDEMLDVVYFEIPNKVYSPPPLQGGDGAGGVIELESVKFSVTLDFDEMGDYIEVTKQGVMIFNLIVRDLGGRGAVPGGTVIVDISPADLSFGSVNPGSVGNFASNGPIEFDATGSNIDVIVEVASVTGFPFEDGLLLDNQDPLMKSWLLPCTGDPCIYALESTVPTLDVAPGTPQGVKSGVVTYTVSGALLDSDCIVESLNGDPDTKLDLVYIGDDYLASELGAFASDVGTFNSGLLGYEPFNSESDKFNIFRIDNTADLGCGRPNPSIPRLIICDLTLVESVAVKCPHDQTLVIVNDGTYGGGAYLSGKLSISYRGDMRVMVHEFGHSFGKLMDEYVLEEDDPGVPFGANCAGEATCSKWSDLIGVEGVGCFLGCTASNWYRPIETNSLMLDLRGDFNPVGERRLSSLLETYI